MNKSIRSIDKVKVPKVSSRETITESSLEDESSFETFTLGANSTKRRSRIPFLNRQTDEITVALESDDEDEEKMRNFKRGGLQTGGIILAGLTVIWFATPTGWTLTVPLFVVTTVLALLRMKKMFKDAGLS